MEYKYFARKQILMLRNQGRFFTNVECFKCGNLGNKALACRYSRSNPTESATHPLKTNKFWRKKDEVQRTSNPKDFNK